MFQLIPGLVSRLSPKQTALVHVLWVPPAPSPSNIHISTCLNILYINNCHRILALHSLVSQNF